MSKDIKHILTGISVYLENKILIVHPTNASWQKANYSIPKGRLIVGEKLKSGAIREFEEETGLKLNSNLINKLEGPFSLNHGQNKTLYYFKLLLNNYNELDLSNYVIPKKLLQYEEVNWGGFIELDEASKKLVKYQVLLTKNTEVLEYVKK